MWTLIAKTRNLIDMHIIRWEEISREVLDYESKLLQIKIPFFHVFHGWHEFNFLKKYIYVNKAILLIFDIFD